MYLIDIDPNADSDLLINSPGDIWCYVISTDHVPAPQERDVAIRYGLVKIGPKVPDQTDRVMSMVWLRALENYVETPQDWINGLTELQARVLLWQGLLFVRRESNKLYAYASVEGTRKLLPDWGNTTAIRQGKNFMQLAREKYPNV